MFYPRRPSLARPHKQRRWRCTTTRVIAAGGAAFLAAWPRIFSVGQGLLAASVVERLVVLAKRVTQTFRTQRRFWVNIQLARTLTQKPLNVRMGKGKGGRQGTVAQVRAGAVLVAFSALRHGLLAQVTRRLQRRANFVLASHTPPVAISVPGGELGLIRHWWAVRCLTPRYVTAQGRNLAEQTQKLRRPILWQYASQILAWEHLRPRAIWVPPYGKRRMGRMRRHRLRRLRLRQFVRPQGTAFLRQIRTQIRLRRQRIKMFEHRRWPRRHYRWQRALWAPQKLLRTPAMPWDRLLRAKRRRRFVPHAYYASLTEAWRARGVQGGAGGQPLGMLGRSGWRLPQGVAQPAISQLLALGALVQAQVFTLALQWQWLIRAGRSWNLRWVDQRKPAPLRRRRGVRGVAKATAAGRRSLRV